MTITYHEDVEQGSDEWKALRCGRLTASETKLILTPTLKIADNDKVRAHVFELAAQRISGYVEPTYIGEHMLRGKADEVDARILYSQKYAEVDEVGFITTDAPGFVIGYSPDGLVGKEGLIECKSRIQKYQIQTITDMEVPEEFVLQLQMGLYVTKRKWIDFVSYSGGLPMVTIRQEPIQKMQDAISEASALFEQKVVERVSLYEDRLKSDARLIPTERKVEQEMFLGTGE